MERTSTKNSLADAKKEYRYNNEMIRQCKKDIEDNGGMFYKNSNGDIVMLPQVRHLRELTKINIILRRQITKLEATEREEKDVLEAEDDPFTFGNNLYNN